MLGSQEGDRVRGTRSVDSNEQRVNVYQDETTVREIDGYSKTSVSSTNFDNFKDDNDGVRLQPRYIYRAQLPMSGSPKAGDLAIYVDDLNHRRLPHCLARNGHPSTSAHGVSLTPTEAAVCRDNDLADGVRVLSSSYPRLSSTSPWPGHTD
ncbi:hypothetical protein T07_14119 [Trichinella nelsoni]|uniref:Uncharacterized protein n=1 Tax=Trichinella nelsoni TaxID=6336 RepID=A0A0V0S3V9_9BILA|nr:hypothetical protein T07_14119 [Trichinella nelsoni]